MKEVFILFDTDDAGCRAWQTIHDIFDTELEAEDERIRLKDEEEIEAIILKHSVHLANRLI